MKKRYILLLMTTALIALGGCSKESDAGQTSGGDSVSSEQSAPEEEETTTEEQSTEETEDIPDEEEVDPFEEVRSMERVTNLDLCDRMEDFFMSLAEDSLYRDEHLRVGDYSIKAMSEYYSVSSMHIVDDYDDANFDIYELSKESKKGMSRDATHYNVDVSPVVDNFYGEYRYNPETAQKLKSIVNVNVHSYNEHNSDVDLTNEFYALVTMDYSGGSWDISGITQPDRDFFITTFGGTSAFVDENEKIIKDAYIRSSKTDVTYPDNVSEVISGVDENDPSTIIPVWEQWYYYVVATELDTVNVPLTPKASLCYIDNDNIPELIVWTIDSDGYIGGSVYGYVNGKIQVYVDTFAGGNGDISECFKYTPRQGIFLMIRVDTSGTTYEKYSTGYRSDDITTHEIDEVYIGTEHGIQVYMLNDVYAEQEEAEEWVSKNNTMQDTVEAYDTVQEAFDNL